MKRRAAKLTVATIILTLIISVVACAPVKPLPTGDYNYFAGVYDNLDDKENVFETIVWNALNKLLATEGNYVILFGGAHDAGTQAVVPYINEVAKSYGIRKIYVFDFKLDGGIGSTDTLNTDVDISTPHEYNFLYEELLTKLSNYQEISGNAETFEATIYKTVAASASTPYVTGTGTYTQLTSGTVITDVGTPKELPKIKLPTLLIYNKANKVGNVAKPIVSLVDAKYTKDGLKTNAAEQTAYKAKLVSLFESLATSVRGNGSGLVRAETYDYYSEESMHLQEATGWSPNATASHIFKSVTYHELIDMFEKKTEFVLLFGGQWCPNTQAMISYINEYGKKYGVETIYIFDTRLDGLNAHLQGTYQVTGETGLSYTAASGAKTDGIRVESVGTKRITTHTNIRGNLYTEGTINSNDTAYARLYVKLLSYLPNFTSSWNTPDWTSAASYKVTIDGVEYPRICVPGLLVWQKGHKDADGKDQPVLASYESEYVWANTSNPTHIHSINIKAGVDAVFKKLPDVLKDVVDYSTGSDGTGGGSGSSSPSGGTEEIC